MNGPRRALVALVVLAGLGLTGCDGAEGAASRPLGTGTPGPSADPLADVEAGVDAIARDLDADSAAATGR